MNSLDQVALFNIGIFLNLKDLLSFCTSDSRINRLICQQDAIWLFKLTKEFPEMCQTYVRRPDWKQHLDMKPRDVYKLLIGLTKLKLEIKYPGSIYQLYEEKKLDLSRKKLISLPSEIGLLSQLRKNNNLVSLPSEIGNLNQLQILDLHNNQLQKLPSEIGKLTQLQSLALSINMIKELPSEIGLLSQLQRLYLGSNKIEKLPSEIGLLSQLRCLYLYDNKIESLPSEISHLRQLDLLYLDRKVFIPPSLKLHIRY